VLYKYLKIENRESKINKLANIEKEKQKILIKMYQGRRESSGHRSKKSKSENTITFVSFSTMDKDWL